MLVDTHCHLDFPEFAQDRDSVVRRARDEGIGYIINIGSSLKGSVDSLELSQKYDFIYAVVGLHPHEADKFDLEAEESIRVLAKKEKVVAIGETGLDYFKNYSKAENQKRLFIALIKLAKDLNKPLVIHTRDAQVDTLSIIKESMPLKAVVHCFSGGMDFLQSCLDCGFFISFTCNITYKKAEALRGIVKAAPLERILLETDAPYLAPEGLRGKRNEPAYVKLLAAEIARIKGIDTEKVAEITTLNAKMFFDLE